MDSDSEFCSGGRGFSDSGACSDSGVCSELLSLSVEFVSVFVSLFFSSLLIVVLLPHPTKNNKQHINKITIFNLRNYLLNEKSRGISDKTLNGIRDVFNSFFGWLWKEGLIENNPCNNLGPIKCIKKIRKPYSDSDIEKLKEKCYDVRDKAFICFMLSTGCRISEICQLNKSDINFVTLECKVLGKGDKERIVFIDDVTSMLLQRYLSERKDEYNALFIGKGTCRMTPGGVRARLKTIAIEAGVENVHPHRFRRTLATNLISHGMAIQDVSMILGHEKIDTTMTYVYRDKESVKNSYKKFSY